MAMVRGFITGIIWGVIISAFFGGAASLFAPLPGRDAIRAGRGDLQQQPLAPAVKDVVASPEPEPAPDPQPENDTTPDPAVTDDMAPTAGADTSPAPQPQTPDVGATMQSPTADSDQGGVSVQSDAPVQPQTDVVAPTAPISEDELSISTDPVQPVLPVIGDSGPAFPDDSIEGVTPAPMDVEMDVTPNGEDPQAEAAPTLPRVIDPDTDAGTDSETGTQAPSPELQPSIGRPAGALDETFPQLQSNRLPSVRNGSEEVTGDRDQDDTSTATSGEHNSANDTAPMIRYASSFSNPQGKPLMAIVLIDEGDTGLDADVLSGFPYPLTFALGTLENDVTAKMIAYRSRGFEVLAMVDLPEFANASDVEVAMPAHLKAIPEAVAVLEGQTGGLQGSKELSTQVTRVLHDSGHGLVMLPNGLNTAQKLAAKDGVPSASVFRDFDGKGQNAASIRRFLDQAAFKAGQEGGVIMLGRLRPETVSALLLWGLADRASSVALAPVSALLRSAE